MIGSDRCPHLVLLSPWTNHLSRRRKLLPDTANLALTQRWVYGPIRHRRHYHWNPKRPVVAAIRSALGHGHSSGVSGGIGVQVGVQDAVLRRVHVDWA